MLTPQPWIVRCQPGQQPRPTANREATSRATATGARYPAGSTPASCTRRPRAPGPAPSTIPRARSGRDEANTPPPKLVATTPRRSIRAPPRRHRPPPPPPQSPDDVPSSPAATRCLRRQVVPCQPETPRGEEGEAPPTPAGRRVRSRREGNEARDSPSAHGRGMCALLCSLLIID